MKRIQHKGRAYLVSNPRLYNGGPKYTCDAWTTKVKRDSDGNKRRCPNHKVKGVWSLNDLAKIFIDGFGTYE